MILSKTCLEVIFTRREWRCTVSSLSPSPKLGFTAATINLQVQPPMDMKLMHPAIILLFCWELHLSNGARFCCPVPGQPVAAVGLRRGRLWRGVGATSLRWGPASSGWFSELFAPRSSMSFFENGAAAAHALSDRTNVFFTSFSCPFRSALRKNGRGMTHRQTARGLVFTAIEMNLEQLHVLPR